MTDTSKPQPTPTTARRQRLSVPSLLVGAAAGFVLGGITIGLVAAAIGSAASASSAQVQASESAAASTEADRVLAVATRACVINADGAELSDEDRTLTIDSEGEEDSGGLAYSELECILSATKAPQAVISHIEQTTSLDGRQTEEWGNIEMSWSYHPDRGTDGVFTLTD